MEGGADKKLGGVPRLRGCRRGSREVHSPAMRKQRTGSPFSSHPITPTYFAKPWKQVAPPLYEMGQNVSTDFAAHGG